jgi:hypothetical protein
MAFLSQREVDLLTRARDAQTRSRLYANHVISPSPRAASRTSTLVQQPSTVLVNGFRVPVSTGTTPSTATTVQRQSSMSLNLNSIIGGVANVVGGIFGNAPTATVPTATTTLGTVSSAVGGVLGAVLPGGIGPVVNGAMQLPGRSSGISDVILENPRGGTSGGGLSRYGIPRGWTRKKVRALVRTVGVSVAAGIIGAPLEGVAITAMMGTGRSRGISARDLRTTKRVTRRVLGIARDLAAIRPPARRAPSRGTRVICN